MAPGAGHVGEKKAQVDRTVPKTLTVSQLAKGASIDASTVRRWCESGKIPARKVGTNWKIKPHLLADAMPDLYEEYAEGRRGGMAGF